VWLVRDSTYIGRVRFSLYYIQYRHVTALLGWVRRDHAILGLQQSPHYVQYSGFAHRLRLFDVLPRKRCIRGHQEMAARGRYQRSYNADQVVMHVSRVSKGGGTSRHDGRHELVRLLERRVQNVQTVCCDF
jgi:hypothetical protein